MGWLADLFDPGRDQRDDAADTAYTAALNSYHSLMTASDAYGPGGLRAGQTTHGIDLSLGQFQPHLQQLLRNSGQQLGANGAQDLGWLQRLFGQTQGQMGRMNPMNGLPQMASQGTPGNPLNQANVQSNANTQGMQGLQQLFQNAQGIASADPFKLGASTTDRLRQQALPYQQRTVNSALSNLLSKGQLGTSGGAVQLGQQQQALDQQDLGFQMAGLEAGRGLQSDALGRMFGAQQGMESQYGRQFGEGMQNAQMLQNQFGLNSQHALGFGNLNANIHGMNTQNALNQYGMNQSTHGMNANNALNYLSQGGNMAQTMLQNLLQGQNMGLQGLQGAASLSQLPLGLLQALQTTEQQRQNSFGNYSNTLLGTASQYGNNSANTPNVIGDIFTGAVGGWAGTW